MVYVLWDMCYLWVECGEGFLGCCLEDCCYKEEVVVVYRIL